MQAVVEDGVASVLGKATVASPTTGESAASGHRLDALAVSPTESVSQAPVSQTPRTATTLPTQVEKERPFAHAPMLSFLTKFDWYRRWEHRQAEALHAITELKIMRRELPTAAKNAIRGYQSVKDVDIGGASLVAIGISSAIAGAIGRFGIDPSAGAALAGACLFLALPALGAPKQHLAGLVDILRKSSNEKIQRGLKENDWLLVDPQGNLVFTNHNHGLTSIPRISTAATSKDGGLIWKVTETCMRPLENLYYRVLWPYGLSMMQLPDSRYESIRKAADIQPGQSLLELSCGAIPYHLKFRKQLGNEGRLVATDGTPEVLGDSQRFSKLVQWIEGRFGRNLLRPEYQVVDSLGRMPFESRTFDRIVAARIYNVDIEECLRVLKPGGKLIIEGSTNTHNHSRAVEEGRMKVSYAPGAITIIEKGSFPRPKRARES